MWRGWPASALSARTCWAFHVVQLRAIAKRTGRNHALAEELWASGIFEARILAAFVAEPARVTRQQANAWAEGFRVLGGL